MLLRVHQSNFRVVGFAERPSVAELAAVARRHALPLLDDLGSGALVDVEGEPTPAAALAAGADLVCFSGDKLLGGPRAGIVAGRADLVERLRRHPLHRALRSDKLTLAALEGTLALYLDQPDRVPVLGMLREPAAAVRARAELAEATGGVVEETVARTGGGALPLAELPSFACAVEEELAAALRAHEPPSSRSCATGAHSSTAAPSRTPRGRRSPQPSRPSGAGDDDETGGGRPLAALLGSARDEVARDHRRPGDRGRPGRRASTRRRLAREVEADPDALHRMLRALASDGVFAEEAPGVYRNTEASEGLRRGTRWHDFAHLFGGVWHQALGELTATGEPTFERVHGTDFWSWLGEHPDERGAFDRAMSGSWEGKADRVASAGGEGTSSSSTSAAATAPSWSSCFAAGPVCAESSSTFPRRHGTRRRSAAASSSSPAASSSVFRPATSTCSRRSSTTGTTTARGRSCARSALLRRTRGDCSWSTPSSPRSEPHGAKLLDLLMLALFGERERDEAQWRALLEANGFEPSGSRMA